MSLVTQVVVDEHDPAFAHPTKPVGQFYTEEQAKDLAESLNAPMMIGKALVQKAELQLHHGLLDDGVSTWLQL